MAGRSNIAWTRSTFNAWIGCTKVGPGCDGCYAEVQDSRKRWGGAAHWGAGVPRYRTSVSNWKAVEYWNALAGSEKATGRPETGKYKWDDPVGYWPVFCNSLGDVFDNEVDYQWRLDLFHLILRTPNLSWLLVTKRIGNVKAMMNANGDYGRIPDNVRILITVVNQEEADRDIPKLLALQCKNGISYEPALGPVDWAAWLPGCYECSDTCGWRSRSSPNEEKCGHCGAVSSKFGEFCHQCHHQSFVGICPDCRADTVTDHPDTRTVEWIIVGGESSQGAHAARPFNILWARDTIRQCKDAGVKVFMKQCGSYPYITRDSGVADIFCPDYEYHFEDRAGSDPAEWPEDLRVREWPL